VMADLGNHLMEIAPRPALYEVRPDKKSLRGGGKLSMVSPSEPSRDERPGYARTKSDMYKEVDAAAGWRRERVLYQCACVAYL
jgi:hypothetical protein